jgi:hypothetical protein
MLDGIAVSCCCVRAWYGWAAILSKNGLCARMIGPQSAPRALSFDHFTQRSSCPYGSSVMHVDIAGCVRAFLSSWQKVRHHLAKLADLQATYADSASFFRISM